MKTTSLMMHMVKVAIIIVTTTTTTTTTISYLQMDNNLNSYSPMNDAYEPIDLLMKKDLNDYETDSVYKNLARNMIPYDGRYYEKKDVPGVLRFGKREGDIPGVLRFGKRNDDIPRVLRFGKRLGSSVLRFDRR